MESYVVKQGNGATTTNGTARDGAHLRQLSEHLFVFEDTCNVYLVKIGEAGLLIAREQPRQQYTVRADGL